MFVLFPDGNKSLSHTHFALVTIGLFLDYKHKRIMCSSQPASQPTVSSEEARGILLKGIIQFFG